LFTAINLLSELYKVFLNLFNKKKDALYVSQSFKEERQREKRH